MLTEDEIARYNRIAESIIQMFKKNNPHAGVISEQEYENLKTNIIWYLRQERKVE